MKENVRAESPPVGPGRFGPYGGRYVPETIIPALEELEAAWNLAKDDPTFRAEVAADL